LFFKEEFRSSFGGDICSSKKNLDPPLEETFDICSSKKNLDPPLEETFDILIIGYGF
jgi:hypothetical protein